MSSSSSTPPVGRLTAGDEGSDTRAEDTTGDDETTPLLMNASTVSDPDKRGVDVRDSPETYQHDGVLNSVVEQADFLTVNEQQDLVRGLKQRHIGLIAIAGAVGTGLFLGLGGAIQTAGPLGALLGYVTVGLIVCCVQFALGEVTALLPVTGSFVRHAEFLVDPAMGFAVGWNLVYGEFRANSFLGLSAWSEAVLWKGR